MKSKRTKALEISPETKHRVYIRDGCCCVWCGSTDALPEAHYIRRSWGGLGVEQNILTLCRACHYRFDSGSKEEREEMTELFRRYLQGIYGEDWDESELYYGQYLGQKYQPDESIDYEDSDAYFEAAEMEGKE